jgi:hypothetical protein
MLLGHDVVADLKAEARPFAGRLGGEERLKELVFDLRWNTNAVVADVDFNRIAQIGLWIPALRFATAGMTSWNDGADFFRIL